MGKRIAALLFCICMNAAVWLAGAPAVETNVLQTITTGYEGNKTAEQEKAAEIIDSGFYQGIEWSLDTNGHLLLAGGEGAESSAKAPWLNYRASIYSAEVKGSGWKSTNYMFYDCGSLKDIDFNNIDTGNVTGMAAMFYGCSWIKELDLSGFDTRNVTNMGGMFYQCSELRSIDLSSFDTGSVKSMEAMFAGCENLEFADTSGFDTANLTEMGEMFAACHKLSAAITFQNNNISYGGCFWDAATIPGSKITVKYSGDCTRETAEKIIETKAETSHVYLEGEEVTAETITLDKSELILKEGESARLTSAIIPVDAWEACIWTSGQPSVASVDEKGNVTGISEGQTVVTVTAGSASAECRVTVSNPSAPEPGPENPNPEPERPENPKPENPDNQEPEPVPATGRIAGTSRYGTAIACAERMRSQIIEEEGGKFSAAVVACADNFPDALAGSTLAASVDAPILLVGKSGSGTEETLSYINENVKKDGMIYLLGGTSAIPESVAPALVSFGFWEDHIKTLAGSTRYETNMKIIEETAIAEGTDVVIVSGKTYADSLSVSGIAGAKGMPIFLAADKLSGEAVKKIEEIAPKHIYLIGGTAAVSEEVYQQAKTLCAPDSVKRIAGASRYATSLAVAEYFGMEIATSAVFAYGGDFPDGLTGGAFAACLGAPVILVSDDNYKEQAEFLANSNIEYTYIMGGTSVISDETMGYLMK